ncbi:lysophospholipid acyltransferase family protein [Acinetobacter sp. TGL-Y2]|uniref:lysophospholipid acyltransferase family protein n=1 Tax=Acinetobacter sp. TGL-Y2 TaxID=1407071 RepID=UPI0009D77307|nr:lysophospholipid acyltransferase family protein [Acinetobacter sp. TGL-Y2]
MTKKALQIQHNSKMIRLGSALQRFYFQPTFLGTEYIDAQKPAMYVGNHTIYGVLDSPVLIDYLFTEHKIAIVSLGDHLHFKVPFWRDLVKKMGAVDGLQEYAQEVMQQGYSLLVFPGGGREVVKRKGEEYQLIWKERYGFLKLAKAYNYDIAPFVALGGDDVYDLAYDANALLEQTWFKKVLSVPIIGQWLRQGEMIPSIPTNIIPKRIPFYFKFLERMNLNDFHTDDLSLFRDEIQQQLYQGIADLKQIRDQSTEKSD